MMNNTSPSLADIAAVAKDNDGFGGNNGWWILIILFAIFGGWGNGWNGNNAVGEMNDYICEQLSKLQMKALDWLEIMASMDMEAVDVVEFGAVTDIVKDLIQSEKYLAEAYYYKTEAKNIESMSDATVKSIR